MANSSVRASLQRRARRRCGGRGKRAGRDRALGSASLPSRLQLAVSLGEDLLGPAFELVLRRDVADGAVKPDGVVVDDILAHDARGVLERERRLGPYGLALERFVPALDFPVALGVVGARAHVRHPADADVLLEAARDELRPVVGDDTRPHAGEALA